MSTRLWIDVFEQQGEVIERLTKTIDKLIITIEHLSNRKGES